jgi:signal transduction histidine kinase
VLAERELEAVFDRLLDVARELTGARYAALGILGEDRRELADFITAGIDADAHAQIGDLPRGLGVLGLLMSEPQPLRLDDVGEHPRSYGFPLGHPPMKTFLGVPVVIRGEAWGNLYLTEKVGGRFDEADEETAIVLAAWAAVAVENARLYRESERGRQRLERSVRALEATSEIARAVGGETQFDRVLELVAERSRALVDASAVVILLVDGDDCVVAATAGDIPRSIIGKRLTAADSIAGRVLTTGRAERTNSLGLSLRFALGEVGVKATSGLFVPLIFRRASIGVLEAFDRVGGPEFEEDDERILQSAAASAATALATAQTLERNLLQRTLRAAENERRRWARELHDETLQALAGLRVLLASARRAGDPAALQSAVGDAIDQIGTEIDSLRALITELRPASLDEIGLGPALDALLDRARDTYGLQIDAFVELTYEGGGAAGRLDPELETVVYRVVQESLNNAGRHANAGSLRVTVLESELKLRVIVSDDGDGFDPAQSTEGFGLAGMRERVTLSGGVFDVSSGPTGTKVEALLPARHQAAQRTA